MPNINNDAYIYDLVGIFNIPVSMYKSDLSLIQHFYDFGEEFDPLVCDKRLLESVVSTVSTTGLRLAISYDGSLVYYVVMLFDDNSYAIAGPLIDAKEDVTEHVRFNALKHNAKVRNITRCSKLSILSAFSLIYKAVYGVSINIHNLIETDKKDFIDMQAKEHVANVLIRSVENTTPHNDSTYELKIRKAISDGNLESLKLALYTPFVGERGIIGYTPIRSHKNLAIVDITIASRAAIDAGIDAELAYVISDGYILQVEKAKTSQEAEDIYFRCAFEFCNLVKNTKTSINTDNKIVKQVVSYINRNFYKKFYLKDIASHLNLSSEYLERVFKEQTKMTIGQYLLDVRLNQAVLLLDGSDKAIYEIASLTGFNSQSYFILQFKRKFNMTPKSYRTKSF